MMLTDKENGAPGTIWIGLIGRDHLCDDFQRFPLTVLDRLIVIRSHAAIVSLGVAIAFFTRWTVAVLTLVCFAI